jgi:hypothetical protein
VIQAPRRISCPWRDSDLAPFAEQNADVVGVRFWGVLTPEQSNAYVSRLAAFGGERLR